MESMGSVWDTHTEFEAHAGHSTEEFAAVIGKASSCRSEVEAPVCHLMAYFSKSSIIIEQLTAACSVASHIRLESTWPMSRVANNRIPSCSDDCTQSSGISAGMHSDAVMTSVADVPRCHSPWPSLLQ